MIIIIFFIVVSFKLFDMLFIVFIGKGNAFPNRKQGIIPKVMMVFP